MCENREENKISPSLSKLEIRAKELKSLEGNIISKSSELRGYVNAIEALNFELSELKENRQHIYSRMSELIREAIAEGYSQGRVYNFIRYDLKLRSYISYLDQDIQDMFEL